MPPPKKFVIQPFKQHAPMDEEYVQKTWKTLRDAIYEIFAHNASGLSFEELYRNAYNMVLHKHGDKLYDGLTATVREHLQRMAEQVEAANDQEFLETLNRKWSDHKLSMIMIRDILMYMDRTYVAQNKKVPVYELGLSLFRDDVVRALRIKERLLGQLLELVRKERDGEMINRRLIKMIVSMLVDLGKDVYAQDFERPFLEATAAFYKHESGEAIAQNSASDYMKRAERRLAEEDERVHQYLDSTSEPRLREVAERELIARHMKTLAEMEQSGLVAMLDDDRRDDLTRTYALFKRVTTPTSGLHVIRDILSMHVREQGKSIVDSVGDENAGDAQRDPISFVDDLLKLKDRYDRIVDDSFSSDKLFHNTLNRAFESFLNLNSRSPEYLSLYVDNLLRRDMKGTSEDEVEFTLDKIVMLFRYLQEKDVFEKYYKQHLAKRLLSGRVTSDDTERAMITKLKTECGFQFTSKIEGMFTDMRTSADTMSGFRQYLTEQAAAEGGGGGGSGRVGTVELNVQVLTTGYWPTQPPSNCIFPPEIQRCVDAFSRFYQSKHSGRTLKWHANMGNADLRATFGTRRHEVNVSTYQMCILLLFNDRDTITYTELSNATHIATPDLKRALQSLACAKFKLLTKEPRGRDVADSDSFSFNESFTAKQIRFKVGTVAATKETDAEKSETRHKVDEDRKPQVEAAIVRIMKSRKALEHNLLIAEVTQQLKVRFMPDPNMIKKRIESLIEREFLERDKDDWRTYKYLA